MVLVVIVPVITHIGPVAGGVGQPDADMQSFLLQQRGVDLYRNGILLLVPVSKNSDGYLFNSKIRFDGAGP